ncbi:colicin immunity domain-containing protein [Nocardia wallacei]|uniref:colicin immunity domain-containing protein n=1 Tax=Nocardia wallacei TaxID=480035 RepID=UPI00245765C5|nr:colicin immunity domain-containing protein [Nocardia wallacei]
MPEGRADASRMPAVYEPLIREFVSGELTADQFETAYLAEFKRDRGQTPGPEFEALDGLFADVDDYVADADLRRRAGGLDEEQLRDRARVVYERLYR